MDNWIIKETIDFHQPEKTAPQKAPYILMLPGDNNAHTWEITCLLDGAAADLTGCSVTGYFLRSDGQTVVVTGSVTGNVAKATLTPQCYAVPGGMRGAIRIDKSGTIVTLTDGAFIVRQNILSDQIINTGEAIPNLAELLAQIHVMESTTKTAMLSLGVGGLPVMRVEDETLYLDLVPLSDDDSYETAVSLGYTGTEEEWEAFVALVEENSSAIAQAQEDAEEALELAQAAQSQSLSVTVAPESWTGDAAPYTATVSCSIATASNNMLVGIGGDITPQAQAAIAAAAIMCTAQGAGTITLKAYAAKPDVAIVVNIVEVK